METIILASNSPRRKELLEQAGIPFIVMPADIDETFDDNKDCYQNVLETAKKKCLAIWEKSKKVTVLSADTIVVLDGVVFGKPKSKLDAYSMLKKLSGKTHKVITAVMIKNNREEHLFYDESSVTFKNLTDKEIWDYIETKEPMDKAGAYAIQGLGGKFISHFEGRMSTIIGLPIELVSKIIKKA